MTVNMDAMSKLNEALASGKSLDELGGLDNIVDMEGLGKLLGEWALNTTQTKHSPVGNLEMGSMFQGLGNMPGAGSGGGLPGGFGRKK